MRTSCQAQTIVRNASLKQQGPQGDSSVGRQRYWWYKGASTTLVGRLALTLRHRQEYLSNKHISRYAILRYYLYPSLGKAFDERLSEFMAAAPVPGQTVVSGCRQCDAVGIGAGTAAIFSTVYLVIVRDFL
jgi:hypothetical protein